ncbi:hypothetical protein Csa_022453 [Cucumis sativus]|uniref:EF-hand domain-containing protein n=1 Tax=Cucumis sativus TaxID=3659 RepID=A0A0A0LKX1_CUCSA|nr:hypothetical protein Csa_022453 [Cucumis sativus]
MALPGVSKFNFSREEMKEIFREHDIDGDGYLSISELIKAMGFLGHSIPFYKAHYGMAYCDENGDGLISEDELDKLIDYAERFQKRRR